MPAIILAAALALGSPGQPSPAACTPNPPTAAAQVGAQPPAFRHLGDLPMAHLERAVLRRIGPCGVRDVLEAGAWVHELDGAAAFAPEPATRPKGLRP